MGKVGELVSERRGEINSFYPLFFTAAFILLLIQYPFSSFESILYDLWIKLHVTDTPEKQFVLITQDENNDQILGEYYPYTYATHSKFLEKVTKDSPFIISYLVNFEEPTQEDDERFYKKFLEIIEDYTKENGVFRIGTSIDFWGEQIPPEEMKKFGYSPALINVDGEVFAKDSVHRKAILDISGEDSLHFWLSNRIRKDQGLEENKSKFVWGAYYNSDADATFVNYAHLVDLNNSDDVFVQIPFYRVLNGAIPPDFFKDKVVLIGPQYSSNSDDFVYTPFSKEKKVSKLALHASMVHSLSQNRTLYPISGVFTDILALFLAIGLSFIISKVQPTRGLLITISLIASVVLVAYVSFVFLGAWLKIAHILLSVFIVYYIWIPYRAIVEYQTRYAIEEESEMLKKVENLKQNFISLMSHDLKTPVAKIAGMADNLKMKVHTEEDNTIIDNIIKSTQALNQFITSILDLTKVESQNLNLNLTSKDVNKIIESVVEKLTYEMETKKIGLDLELSPLYPIQLDQNLIHRVISNLVENAIKYSGEGSQISVKTFDNDEWVTIEIADNGAGISPDDLSHIFEKFYRVKNDSTHKIKGSGLGLYLVKYFIELHKGTISVQSEIGKGTTFTIKLINK